MHTKVKKLISASLIVVLAIPVSNCARRIGANQFSAASVGESIRSYEGTIISKRVVEVNEAERISDNTGGALIGAGAGGVLGYQFGKGKGNALATGLGALAGGAAGMFAEDALGRQEAYEYTVRINNGNTIRNQVDGDLRTVVQGLDVDLAVGQRVILQEARNGRSRVVPM